MCIGSSPPPKYILTFMERLGLPLPWEFVFAAVLFPLEQRMGILRQPFSPQPKCDELQLPKSPEGNNGGEATGSTASLEYCLKLGVCTEYGQKSQDGSHDDAIAVLFK